MDKPKSASGYPRLGELVILTQTDTTVGFLSQSKERLDAIKGRPPHKPYLINFFDLKTAKRFVRIPKNRRKELRRAKRTTYIVKGQAFRVARPKTASKLFNDMKWCYSTSANQSGKSYDESFAKEHADVIIENLCGLYESIPSRLIKLNAKAKKRLR